VTKAKEQKMHKAIYVSTTGEVEVREFVKDDSYELIRNAVEGWIECVHLNSLGVDMWVNEEGKIYNLDANEFGTFLYSREFGVLDMICGNIIFTVPTPSGDTVGLSSSQIEKLTELLGYDVGELQTA
jgi:hypothetical protein